MDSPSLTFSCPLEEILQQHKITLLQYLIKYLLINLIPQTLKAKLNPIIQIKPFSKATLREIMSQVLLISLLKFLKLQLKLDLLPQ